MVAGRLHVSRHPRVGGVEGVGGVEVDELGGGPGVAVTGGIG